MGNFKKFLVKIAPIDFLNKWEGLPEEVYKTKIEQILKDFCSSVVYWQEITSNRTSEEIMEMIASSQESTESTDTEKAIYTKIEAYLKIFLQYKTYSYCLSIAPTTEIQADKHTRVLFSESIKRFQIIRFENQLGKKALLTRPYELDDIWEYELICDSVLQVKNTRGVAGAIVGGMLFGPVGSVAGAMTSGSKTKEKNKYAVRLSLNDMELASIEIPCQTREIAYRLVSTFAVFEKRIKQ